MTHNLELYEQRWFDDENAIDERNHAIALRVDTIRAMLAEEAKYNDNQYVEDMAVYFDGFEDTLLFSPPKSAWDYTLEFLAEIAYETRSLEDLGVIFV